MKDIDNAIQDMTTLKPSNIEVKRARIIVEDSMARTRAVRTRTRGEKTKLEAGSATTHTVYERAKMKAHAWLSEINQMKLELQEHQ